MNGKSNCRSCFAQVSETVTLLTGMPRGLSLREGMILLLRPLISGFSRSDNYLFKPILKQSKKLPENINLQSATLLYTAWRIWTTRFECSLFRGSEEVCWIETKLWSFSKELVFAKESNAICLFFSRNEELILLWRLCWFWWLKNKF